MSTDKKDLEIVYNLQWKRKINNPDDKANIVGMLDTPATTLNWEVFKSYLLKNAGAMNPVGDINVSYLDSDDDEIPIDSQTEFQAALYSFRKRAHAGEIITLKLDKAYNYEMKPLGTQQHQQQYHQCPDYGFDAMNQGDSEIPEWFQKYMIKYKSQLVEEITSSVITHLKSHSYSPCTHIRKPKNDSSSKMRYKKLVMHNGEPVKDQAKEYVKALKIERKLDSKLEKLEHKTKKIKEKKLQLGKHPEYNAIRRPIGQPLTVNEVLMDAAPLDRNNGPTPHFMGGETFVQEWNVINNGQLPWTEETELRHAWGSQTLSPIKRSVCCPALQPGEVGVVRVLLQIPTTPGNYECYWHFYHNNRRFGHWLGVQIVVDPPANYAMKTVKCRLFQDETSPLLEHDKLQNLESLNEVKIEKDGNNLQQQQPSSDDIEKVVTTEEDDVKKLELKMIDSLILTDDSSADSSEHSEYEVICMNNKEWEKNDTIGADFVQVRDVSLSDQGSDDNNNNNTELPQNDGWVCDEIVPERDESTRTEAAAVAVVNKEELQTLNDSNYESNNEEVAGAASDSNVPGVAGTEPVQTPKKDEMCDSAFFDPLLQQSGWKQMDESLMTMSKLLQDPIIYNQSTPPIQQVEVNQQNQMQQYQDQDFWNWQMQQNASVNLSGYNQTHGSCHSNNPGAPPPAAAPSASQQNFNASSGGAMYVSDDSRRLFVFPHKCPGYEVVYPVNNGNMSQSCNIDWNIPRNDDATSVDSSRSSQKYAQIYSANVDRPYCQSPGSQNGSCQDNSNLKHQQHQNCATSNAQMPPPPMGPTGPSIQILPETFMAGAVNVASSAINTAKSVLHMLRPGIGAIPADWHSASWAPNAPHADPIVEDALRRLQEMGFWNRELNITLLAKHKNDLEKVISDLIQ